MSITFEVKQFVWFGINLFRMFAPNNKTNVMKNEDKETFLGKAMIQLSVSVVFTFCAVAHESMTWTIGLGFLGLVWGAAAHENFNKYERRG